MGWNSSGTISNCYSTSVVNGGENSYSIGGLVGGNWDGSISDCYSMGTVTGGDYLGGLVGYNWGGSISGCYSTGAVTGFVGVGGLVGWTAGNDTTSGSYFLVTSGPSNGYGTPLTDTQLKQQSSFLGWDFDNIWHICETFNYPKFIWQIPLGDIVCPDGVDFFDLAELCKQWLIERIPFDIAPLRATESSTSPTSPSLQTNGIWTRISMPSMLSPTSGSTHYVPTSGLGLMATESSILPILR